MIGTEVAIETDYLPILGMVSGCATPDLAMLRWIAYVKSLNPGIRHIFGKDNAMADMLSRVRFDNEDNMVSEDEEVGVDFFGSAQVMANGRSTPTLKEFNENEYEGEWIRIDRFLRTLTPDVAWMKEEVNRIQKKARSFFLRNGSIWKHPKKRNDIPLYIVKRRED